MLVVGYSDRLSVAPGESIRFMVSCARPAYRASVVRLRHGDLNPAGPGFRVDAVPSSIEGTYPGRRQAIHAGSYVVVREPGTAAPVESFTLCCWAFPTTPGGHAQALVTRWSDADAAGFALFLTPEGDLGARVGGGAGRPTLAVRTGQPLRSRQWYFLACTFDRTDSTLRVVQQPLMAWPHDSSAQSAANRLDHVRPGDARVPLLIAASHRDASGRPDAITDFFNGKIERPLLIDRALDSGALASLANGRPPEVGGGVVGMWDFAVDMAGDTAADVSGRGLHGRIVNMPMRAVTGRNWTGSETDFAKAPDQYGAIHFHEDDLEDAGWDVAFGLTVPGDWKSGIYAVKLSTDDFEDYVPFVLHPPRNRATAPIAFLVPTLTYLAYANDHMPTAPGRLLASRGISLEEFLARAATPYESSVFRYIVEQRLHSSYDLHVDGSGVCYVSRLQPLTNIRPRYNKPNLLFRYPHLLSCDLYLVDWLQEKGFEYDTIDDESLHAEGKTLLSRYKVIITGTHPEYWTEAMLRGLREYLADGGRLMYLGGNGFYWVTSVDPKRPHVIEIRRGFAGTRTWSSAPGECHHSTTGEPGGLWRLRGLAPQATVGVGFCAACGLEPARPYRRTGASRDSRAAFIFDGVDDEVLGDFGIHMGAAAGWELDRTDTMLGTPAHALVVATSFGHTAAYLRAIEELEHSEPLSGDAVHPDIRADLTYFEGPNGGAVFSVGSISWCGALSHNGYDNNVSRVTENVLRAFASD